MPAAVRAESVVDAITDAMPPDAPPDLLADLGKLAKPGESAVHVISRLKSLITQNGWDVGESAKIVGDREKALESALASVGIRRPWMNDAEYKAASAEATKYAAKVAGVGVSHPGGREIRLTYRNPKTGNVLSHVIDMEGDSPKAAVASLLKRAGIADKATKALMRAAEEE